MVYESLIDVKTTSEHFRRQELVRRRQELVLCKWNRLGLADVKNFFQLKELLGEPLDL